MVLVEVFCGSCGGGFLVVLVVIRAVAVMFGRFLVHLGMGGGFYLGFGSSLILAVAMVGVFSRRCGFGDWFLAVDGDGSWVWLG